MLMVHKLVLVEQTESVQDGVTRRPRWYCCGGSSATKLTHSVGAQCCAALSRPAPKAGGSGEY